MPGAGPGAAAAAAAALGGVGIVDDADVGALKGVAELGVVQLADGAGQVLWGVELHHSQHAAAVAEHVHVVWRAHLAEVVLPRKDTVGKTFVTSRAKGRRSSTIRTSLATSMAYRHQECKHRGTWPQRTAPAQAGSINMAYRHLGSEETGRQGMTGV